MCNQVGPQIVTAENVFQFFRADQRSFFIVWSDGSVDRIYLPAPMPSSSRLAFCVAVTAKRIGEQNLREILNKYLKEETPLEDGYIVNVAPPTKEEFKEDSYPVTLSRIERIEFNGDPEDMIITNIDWKSEDGSIIRSHTHWHSLDKHPYSPIIGVCYCILRYIESNTMFGSWFGRLDD